MFSGCKGSWRDGWTGANADEADRHRERQLLHFFLPSFLPSFLLLRIAAPTGERANFFARRLTIVRPSLRSLFSNNSALNHFFYAPPSLPPSHPLSLPPSLQPLSFILPLSSSVHSNRSGGGDDNSAVVKFQGCGIGRGHRPAPGVARARPEKSPRGCPPSLSPTAAARLTD